MDYLDFELKIGAGAGREYPVEVIRSPAGEQRATMLFPFDELELKNRLQGLQIALLRSGGTRRDVMRPQERQSVEDFGRTLFAALLPDEVRSCYRLSREKALTVGKGLRLRLRIEAPDLAALPWEYLYDDAEGDFICLSNETPVIRYLELDRPPAPLHIEPPLRILGLIASPEDRPPLDVEKERARMEAALQDLSAQGRVALTWLEGQTWRDLQRAMRQGPWHVFHFVGHGGFDAVTGEGMLALADEDGRTFRLPATKLGRLLADHNALRLAVLNACEGAQASETDIFSSTASVLIRRGIPAVVAMQYEITDRAAIEFAHVFYETVAEGLPVDAAVAEARKAISLSAANTVEWGTPVLHMRAPDGRLFDVDPGAATPEAAAGAAPAETPAPDAEALEADAQQPEATGAPIARAILPQEAPPPPAAQPPDTEVPPQARVRTPHPAPSVERPPTPKASSPVRKIALGAGALVVVLLALWWFGGGQEPDYEVDTAGEETPPGLQPGAAAAESLIPLHLFLGTDGHYLTTSLTEVAGYDYYGVEACLCAQEDPNTRPYTLYSLDGTTRGLFSAATSEGFDAGEALPEWQQEGFIFTSEQPNSIPLVLYFDEALVDVVAVASEETKQDLEAEGYERVRVEGYVFPASYCQ